MKKLGSIAVVLSIALTGCAGFFGGSPGASESSTAPKIVNKDGVPTWNNPSLFGPVPVALAAKGAAACAALNNKDQQFEERGYHSRALDINGNPFPAGGYYCVRK